jgi:hypothetical protein
MQSCWSVAAVQLDGFKPDGDWKKSLEILLTREHQQ